MQNNEVNVGVRKRVWLKRILAIVLVTLAVLALAAFIVVNAVRSWAKTAIQVDIGAHQFLETAAEMANRMTPRMITDDFELRRVEARERSLVYHIRLVRYTREQARAIPFFSQEPPILIRQICTHREKRRRFIDRGVSLKYIYTDSNGDLIRDYLINSESCRS